jgi:ribulose-phosphate 3-epimerase
VTWADWVREAEIEPSIYAADFTRLGAQLEVLLGAGARIFHFDVGDGRFIREITIGPVVLKSIAPFLHGRGARIDCHLMIAEPDLQLESIREAGGDSITFHVEASADPARTIARARGLGLGVGVAFTPDTEVATAARAAEGADLALCMSIHPGLSGQTFMPEAIDRIAELRRSLPGSVLVQVDGGIRAGNVRPVREAGADLLVAGSAVLWTDDPAAAYRSLAAELAAGAPSRGH